MALGKNLKKDTLIPTKKKEKKDEQTKVENEKVSAKKTATEKTQSSKAKTKKAAVSKEKVESKPVAKKKAATKKKAAPKKNTAAKKSNVEKAVSKPENVAPKEEKVHLSPAQAILEAEKQNPPETKKETSSTEEKIAKEESNIETPIAQESSKHDHDVEVIDQVVKEKAEETGIVEAPKDAAAHEDTLIEMQRDIIKKQVGTIKYLTQEEYKERERLKRKFDKDVSSYAGKDVQLITFRLGVERYAIEIDKVKEVVPTPYISAIPHAPGFIKGVSNIRGAVMVILDLAEKFKIDTENKSREFVLVTQSDNSRAGLLVDEVPITMKVAGDTIVSSSGILQNTSLDETYIKGLIKTDEGMIIFIDIAELIKEDEVSIVSSSIMG